MSEAPIHRFIVPIMGFTQQTARPTGLEKLWRQLREHSAPDCCILTPRQWDDNWQGIAQFIDRNAAEHARIDVVAYSWGAGDGFIKLAESLGRLPVPRSVEMAVLADPIYRSPMVPFVFRSLLNTFWAPSIIVPDNVRRVRWTRQNVNKPAGHDLRRTDGSVRGIGWGYIRGLRHEQMDDDPAFHEMAMEELFAEGVPA